MDDVLYVLTDEWNEVVHLSLDPHQPASDDADRLSAKSAQAPGNGLGATRINWWAWGIGALLSLAGWALIAKLFGIW